MERFTNCRTEYWNAIKTELLNFSEYERDQSQLFTYLEMGQLLTHGFAVQQTSKNINDLKLRVWDSAFDNKRFNLGIYNLDRLAVTEKTICLNSMDTHKIKRWLAQRPELINWNGIIVDGLFCQLEIKDEKIEWNINAQINSDLVKFVEFLRVKAYNKNDTCL